jgi:hypothetical protein
MDETLEHLRRDFLRRAAAVAAARQWKTSTLSKRLFNDSRTFDRFASGEVSILIDTFNEAVAELRRLENEAA